MGNDPIVQQTVGTGIRYVAEAGFYFGFSGFVYSGFYQHKNFSKAVAGLRFYGKMSLTNYISQSIIGAFIYFPIGLNLTSYCDKIYLSLSVGFLIFLLQLKFL